MNDKEKITLKALLEIANEKEIHTKLNQERLCCKFQGIAIDALEDIIDKESGNKIYEESVKKIINYLTNRQVKMVIICRKDLNMRKGKLAVQIGHAVTIIMKKMYQFPHDRNSAFEIWLNNDYKKIVLGCNSEEELYNIENECNDNNLVNELIIDNGSTEFKNKKTITCICIGPAWDDEIDKITNKYKLL